MTQAAVPGVTRHFVTLGARQVHYRRAGKGCPLIALHRVPRSSRDLLPCIDRAMGRFTVVAPDLAGYGQSWALAATAPSVADYAADVVATMDALSLKRALFYGEREGGAVALELARTVPDRVAALAINELEIWTPEDATPALAATKPFVPAWDGSHLSWLWAYLREENAFAPWWRKRLATRVDDDMPAPTELHARAIQFLTAGVHGRNYELGLRAALAFDARAAAAGLPMPCLILGARSRHADEALHRLEGLSSTTGVQTEELVADCARAAFEFLARHGAGLSAAPPPPAVQPVPGRLWSDFANIPGGQVHFQLNTDAVTVPLLVQHDAASSVGTVEPVTRSFIGRRTVVAFDLPGSGESDNSLGDHPVEVAAYAESLSAALDDLGLDRIDFYGMWGGGFVGLELALRQPRRVRRLVMSNVFQHDGAMQRRLLEHYTPAIEPLWHGGHLMQCWHQLRDQGIYFPWFDATRHAVVRREPFLDTDMVHERVCSLLKAGNMYRTAYQAHFRYRTFDRLRDASVPAVLAIRPGDPNNPRIETAARASSHVVLRHLAPEFKRWGECFADVLEAADRERA